MLNRYPLWVPVAAHAPSFLERYTHFTRRAPHPQFLLATLNYRPEDTQVLRIPDTRGTGRSVSLAMAFPFTITAAACDVGVGMTPADTPVMSSGALTSLVDTTTSLHLEERLLPESTTHVSVNIQVKSLHPIHVGDKVVLISRMDKLGARLAFLSAEVLHDTDGEDMADAAETQATKGAVTHVIGEQVGSPEELDGIIQCCRVLAKGTHVKCLLRS